MAHLMATLRAVKRGTGIHLTYGEITFALDTGIRGVTTLLSHAHADHIGGIEKAKQVFSTRATHEALEARGGKLPSHCNYVNYEETIGKIGAYITPLNAGHVIGSSMFKIEFDDGMTVLYTGDFNVIDSVVHSAATPIKADVLIMEATYGTPQWIFPDRTEIHDQIVERARNLIEIGKVPIFQAYSLGKAQEAIGLLNEASIQVVSGNPAIDSVSDVYNSHGNHLSYVSVESPEAKETIKEGCAIVSSHPNHTLSHVSKNIGLSYRKDLNRRMERYNLSGWTLGEYKNEGFPLSAHTDFPHLISFAEAVQPKIVYCFTRNAGILSKHLSLKGINAVPLE
ncbi:MAG: MBL fold metallo-hydrolase [Candidatus Thorarchaeota archaeon]